MKTFAFIAGLLACALPQKPAEAAQPRRQLTPADPLDTDRLLWAIEQAENTPHDRVGRDGERSSFQITAAVWAKYSTFPFFQASSNRLVCKAEARRVAKCHLDSLRVQLAGWELPDTPRMVALAWTAGMWATVNGTASAAKRDYAGRCASLYFSSHE